jgi:hypothetical protein
MHAQHITDASAARHISPPGGPLPQGSARCRALSPSSAAPLLPGRGSSAFTEFRIPLVERRASSPLPDASAGRASRPSSASASRASAGPLLMSAASLSLSVAAALALPTAPVLGVAGAAAVSQGAALSLQAPGGGLLSGLLVQQEERGGGAGGARGRSSLSFLRTPGPGRR